MDPIKQYVDIALVIAVLIGIGWVVHRIEVIGEQKVIVAQRAADLKEQAHVAKVNADATASIQDLQVRLAGALVAPPKPAIVVRVCQHPNGAIEPARSDSGPSPGGNETPGSGSGVGGDDLGLDIAPPTEAILKRDKAVIDYLQGYVHTCQTAGLCAK